MTNEEIDRLLEQAVREAKPEELYKYPFARLVAAHEREQCAKLCEDRAKMFGYTINDCLNAIKARSK